MSVRAAADQSYENLKTALAEGKLPPNVADTAVKLCERLHEPVRVSVMGLPGSGKSTIVNLLLNKIVLPEGVRLPTAQFVNGTAEQAILTLADGSTTTVDGVDPHDIAALDPIFVEFQMPLPALGRISVLEVVAPEAAKDQQRAMLWAAKRTDIALWCTHGFTSIEQALWGSLPEKVKDHALMLITRADLLAQHGTLTNTVEEIRFGSAHEFNKIMPIATTDAIAARRADGSVDKPLMQKSGGLTLISSILRQVDQGLRATVDQADLILHKFKDAAPNPDAVRLIEKAAPRPITRPVHEAPKKTADDYADKPVVEVTTSRPVATGTSRPIETNGTPAAPDAFILRGHSAVYNPAPSDAADDHADEEDRVATPSEVTTEVALPESGETTAVEETVEVPPAADAPAPAPQDTQPVAMERPRMGRPVSAVVEPDPNAPRKPRIGFMPKAKVTSIAPPAKPETCAAYSEAIAYLTQQGRKLSEEIASGSEISSDDLMSASAENIMWLSDYLEDLSVSDDPMLEKARTRALDASELLQLMQFESNENAGIEALTLVIQLKRDLEAEVARSRGLSAIKAA